MQKISPVENVKKFIQYYIGHVRFRYRYIDYEPGQWSVWVTMTHERYAQAVLDKSIVEVQIELRKLDSMTKEEMTGLLLSMIPPEMQDAPDADDYDLDMFYNDGGNMVDGDVAAGANYSCRCYEGQIAIRQNGDVDLFDEEGERERFINQTAAFHYLLSRGFDLFGLIDAGLDINKETLSHDPPRS